MATGGPRLGRAVPRTGGVPVPLAEPPAVVGLVAGRPDADLFTVTMLDLAARGWFRLCSSLPDPRAPVPAMCVLSAETPVEELTPYERQAADHLSRRAGPLPEIPAAALADGFEGGEGPFRQAFRGEVVAAARHLGLTRPTLSTARKAVLSLFALVPAGVARAFEVRPADYRRLAPGTLARIRINARLNKLVDIEATRPPAMSPKIADPAQPAGPP
jgi:hypothetical protein